MTAETHTEGFMCKAAFGLGVTSCADFVRNVGASKVVRAAGMAYVNATTARYDGKAGLVVFDGLRELGRWSRAVQPTQVVVVSEVVTLIKEITGLTPLDFQNHRSFEFNFVKPDLMQVVRAVTRREGRVTVGFINRDSLGFHIDVAAKPDAFVSAFMALMSSLSFQYRARVRTALTAYFTAETPDPEPVLATVRALERLTLPDEIAAFVQLFSSEHARYHAAVRSDKSAEWVSKRFEVDAYAIAYLRKMTRNVSITAFKVANHDKAASTGREVHGGAE